MVGELTDQDGRDFAAALRASLPVPGEDDTISAMGTVKEEMLREPAKLEVILNRAKADPYEQVRIVAPKLLPACAQGYSASGQFTNAVNICRQAILANPQEAWGYNQLAWIKATCADASVRDGKEAVSAATRACELTQWKQENWIDTLAAAYAEAGDFKRAIAFEEQALRTGHPTESEQKGMRERLSLYQQSRPFRDKT